MGKENPNEPEQPDTIMGIQEAITNSIDAQLSAVLNPDAPALTEAMRKQVIEVAKRSLAVKRTDLENELAGTEDEVTDLKLEYEETGDPVIGQKLDEINPHYLKMLVEKGNLPPKTHTDK